MTIKQQGGIFGRNPAFNNVDIEGDLTVAGTQTLQSNTIIKKLSPTLTLFDTTDGVGLNAVVGKVEFFGSDGSSGGPNNRATIEVLSENSVGNAHSLVFKTSVGNAAPTEAARFNSSGNLAFPSGKGIDFSATSGTGTSELFDDYEEGTFTVTDTSGAGLTFVQKHGFYTKVGRLVHCHIFVQYPSTANGSDARLGGFPFAAASLGASMGGAWGYSNGTGAVAFTIGQGATDIGINDSSGGSLTNANMSGSFNYITVTYQAS